MDWLSDIRTWLSDNEAAISAVAAMIVIGGVVLAGLRLLVRRRGEAAPEVKSTASAESDSAADASAPDLDPLTVPGFEGRPAIAVLPFDNLSGDPDQEYFADGIAEDLITRLSAWRDFPVIARNSSFTYKGKAVDVKQVSQELGVRYVVEGSVRKVGEQVRISAQLIDATTGAHVWAETYDRDLRDIFAIQDEITEAIVGRMHPELIRSETVRASRKDPANLDAWECYWRGWWHRLRLTKEDNSRARHLFQKASELDPQSAWPFVGLSIAHRSDLMNQWTDSRPDSVVEMERTAQRALALDPDDPYCQLAWGMACEATGDSDKAVATFETIVRLNPSMAEAFFHLGKALAGMNRPAEAIPCLERARRLSPHDMWMHDVLAMLALACIAAGQPEEALGFAQQSVQRKPDNITGRLILAGCYAELERIAEARAAVEELLRLSPGFTLTGLRPFLSGWDPLLAGRTIDALRKAGLPE
jgi:adenylate cyclase